MSFRRRLFTQLYKIDPDYNKYEGNEYASDLQIIAYEDTNGDSLPDHLIIKGPNGSGHERVNFEISNLIIGQVYKITFDQWTNAAYHKDVTENWLYGCAITPNTILDKGAGKSILSTYPMWECPELGKLNQGSIQFTATANTMYWVWDFGALSDRTEFAHKVSNVNLELIAPVFNLNNCKTAFGVGVYEKISAVNNDIVNFEFTGGSGIEVIYYPVTGLAANQTYKFTFRENYNNKLLSNKFVYGTNVVSTLPTTTTTTDAVVFNEENLEGYRERTFEFKPTTTAGYWVWNLGRWLDDTEFNVTFDIVKLEIKAPDGTYKTLIG